MIQNLFEEYQNIIPKIPTPITKTATGTISVDSCLTNFEKKYDSSPTDIFNGIRNSDFDKSSPLFNEPLFIPYLQIIDILFIIYLKREEKITLDTYVNKKMNTLPKNESQTEKEGIASLIDLESTTNNESTTQEEPQTPLEKLKQKYLKSFIIWYCKKFRGYIDELKTKTFPKVLEKKYITTGGDTTKYGDYFSTYIYFVYFLNKLKFSDRAKYVDIINELNKEKIDPDKLNKMYDDLMKANEIIEKELVKPIEGLSCFEQLYNKTQYFKILNGSKKELFNYLNQIHLFATKIESADSVPKITILSDEQKIIGADIKKRNDFVIYCYTTNNKTEEMYHVKYRESENKNSLQKIIEITCVNPKSDNKIAKIEYQIPFITAKEKRSLFKKNYAINTETGIGIRINDSKYFNIGITDKGFKIKRREKDSLVSEYFRFSAVNAANEKKHSNALKILLSNFENFSSIKFIENFGTEAVIPFELIITLISGIVFNVFADKFEGIELKKKRKPLFSAAEKKKAPKKEEKFEKIDYLEKEYAE